MAPVVNRLRSMPRQSDRFEALWSHDSSADDAVAILFRTDRFKLISQSAFSTFLSTGFDNNNNNNAPNAGKMLMVAAFEDLLSRAVVTVATAHVHYKDSVEANSEEVFRLVEELDAERRRAIILTGDLNFDVTAAAAGNENIINSNINNGNSVEVTTCSSSRHVVDLNSHDRQSGIRRQREDATEDDGGEERTSLCKQFNYRDAASDITTTRPPTHYAPSGKVDHILFRNPTLLHRDRRHKQQPQHGRVQGRRFPANDAQLLRVEPPAGVEVSEYRLPESRYFSDHACLFGDVLIGS